MVLDLEHMPGGCAQWPAFWTADPGNWPGAGEIDMIEVALLSFVVYRIR